MYPTTRVYLGVNEDLGSLPHHQIFELEEPVNIAGEEKNHLSVSHYCYDKTLTSEGKSLVNIGFSTNHDYWKNLYSNRELYKKEKQAVADRAIDELDKRYPRIREKIEMIDVTTPVTYERYTNTWQGSYMGWMPTPETMSLKLPKTLPGLSNFYMAGQWLESLGGLINAALSGRDVLKLITKNDGKKFITSKP
jgi:phytoene dehydrogenase-like protein